MIATKKSKLLSGLPVLHNAWLGNKPNPVLWNTFLRLKKQLFAKTAIMVVMIDLFCKTNVIYRGQACVL